MLPAEQNIIEHQPAEYIPRGSNTLKTIIQNHFSEFSKKYSEKYNTKQGKLRLERIQDFVDGFIAYGDYTRGIARIECSNLLCDHTITRPFSCKKFFLCPSCHQKRAILFGEHIANEVLFRLPHRHFCFSFPKMSRPYFKHNKKVLSETALLINDMIVSYYCNITGKKIRTGIVLAFHSFGEFLRGNSHFHSLIFEGGFDEYGNFIHIPILDLTEMKECFRQLVVNHFKNTDRITEKRARNLLSWKHSGFNIDNSIRIMGYDNKARESLAQYIARCPISLKKLYMNLLKGR